MGSYILTLFAKVLKSSQLLFDKRDDDSDGRELRQ